MEKKTLNTFSLTMMCIGGIIGGGIFGSMCTAVNTAGAGIVLALIVALITSVVYSVPGMLPAATIPARSGYYTMMSRLIHPMVGVLELANLLSLVVLNVALAATFASYFTMIVPISFMVAVIGILVVFCITTLLGISFGAKIQNVMCVTMIIAILMFVLMGFSHIDSANFTLKKAFSLKESGVTTSAFFAATALMVNSLQGGNVGMTMAHELKDPRKMVVSSYLISTSLVAVIYALLGITVAGVNPNAGSLAEVAKSFMGNGPLTFFILGGAVMAIATTINGLNLIGAVRVEALAADMLLPEAFLKKNRFGQSYLGVLVIFASSIVIALFDLPIGTLFSVLSAISLFMNAIQLIPVLKLKKRYPNSYNASMFKMPWGFVIGMVILAACFCLYQAYALVVESTGMIWIATGVVIVLFYVWYFIRKGYLKGKGIDLNAIMSAPIPEWEEREAALAKAAKNA